MKITLLASDAFNLHQVIRGIIAKNNLYSDEMPQDICNNKWSALTKRNIIAANVKEAITNFEKDVITTAQNIIEDFQSESKLIDVDFSPVKDEKPEEAMQREKEKIKLKESKKKEAIDKLNEFGIVYSWVNGIPFIVSLKKELDTNVEIDLDDERKQYEFVQWQLENNTFDSGVNDEALGRLAIAFKLA